MTSMLPPLLACMAIFSSASADMRTLQAAAPRSWLRRQRTCQLVLADGGVIGGLYGCQRIVNDPNNGAGGRLEPLTS